MIVVDRTAAELALRAALARFVATSTCPTYLKTAAIAWLKQ